MSRRAEPPENADFADFARRIIARLGARVAAGDIDALPDLLALRDLVDEQAATAVAALRAEPHLYSRQQIADRLGITRQAVTQRWPQPDPDRARRPGGQPAGLR